VIHIDRISDDIEKEIDRLAAGPTIEDYEHFEANLIGQFAETQATVHVITGSLKSSGKISSRSTDTRWEGEITYGGPSAGVHNPVEYAEFERNRDGNHDFLAPVSQHEAGYISAMNSFLGVK
jgi:hypothetical protein